MPVNGSEQYALPLEETYRLVEESKSKVNGLAKKGVFIAPHNFGKLEVCGFLPSSDNPQKIVTKWHEIAMPQYLPNEFKEDRVGTLRVLDFEPDSLYCTDHVFEHNGLLYVSTNEQIVEKL